MANNYVEVTRGLPGPTRFLAIMSANRSRSLAVRAQSQCPPSQARARAPEAPKIIVR